MALFPPPPLKRNDKLTKHKNYEMAATGSRLLLSRAAPVGTNASKGISRDRFPPELIPTGLIFTQSTAYLSKFFEPIFSKFFKCHKFWKLMLANLLNLITGRGFFASFFLIGNLDQSPPSKISDYALWVWNFGENFYYNDGMSVALQIRMKIFRYNISGIIFTSFLKKQFYCSQTL